MDKGGRLNEPEPIQKQIINKMRVFTIIEIKNQFEV